MMMNEFKGTPGPWELVGYVEHCSAYCIKKQSGKGLFYIELYAYIRNDRDSANARLIAAAPELLEALQTIVINAQPFISAFEFDAWDRDVDGEKMFENAVKAINKAIGE